MKKTTKAAIAIGAAAVLLMGGAGTLAFWIETGEAEGGTLTSGELTLDATDCETAGWVYADSDAHGTGEPVTLIVPGDTVEKSCDVVIGGTGDHLRAEINTDDIANVDIGTDTLTVTAGVTGVPLGTAIDIDGPTTATITITAAFPYGTEADNGSELSTATLDTIELEAVQVHD